MFYYDELPSKAGLERARQQNSQAELIEFLGHPSDGAFGESLQIDGVECQFAHATIAQWEREITRILEDFEIQSPMMKGMSGTLNGVPLYGEPLIQQWKARIANFPDGLAQAMVKHYLTFVPVWGMQEKLARRDATLWYSQIMVESAQNILGVLAGLNRQYYSTFQFKRMGRFIDQLAIAPENLALRLESLFHLKADAAVCELEGLVRATIALIETHMPQVDTVSAKRKLGWRQQPWSFG
ncbi:hypothetical protein [Nodosilinea sp. LEGE 07298]|uniref:hypothetical protein n=1 Tax=Nodosilinea sp. LEGE 07298 TaxID=2777970 RepID=UPI001D140843|nr:hypothetical protein [Nodosilinea sp. LEGE 07298]